MKIAIVGLGLIGGSLAKSIKKNTGHDVFGLDINKETIKEALAQEAIDGERIWCAHASPYAHPELEEWIC